MSIGKFKGILTVAVACTAFFLTEPIQAQSKLQTDKAAHFGIAAAAQTSCSALGRIVSGQKWIPGITCFLLINTVGAVKEATDPERGGTRDKKDIYANLAGSGLSLLTISIAF